MASARALGGFSGFSEALGGFSEGLWRFQRPQRGLNKRLAFLGRRLGAGEPTASPTILKMSTRSDLGIRSLGIRTRCKPLGTVKFLYRAPTRRSIKARPAPGFREFRRLSACFGGRCPFFTTGTPGCGTRRVLPTYSPILDLAGIYQCIFRLYSRVFFKEGRV